MLTILHSIYSVHSVLLSIIKSKSSPTAYCFFAIETWNLLDLVKVQNIVIKKEANTGFLPISASIIILDILIRSSSLFEQVYYLKIYTQRCSSFYAIVLKYFLQCFYTQSSGIPEF